MSTVLIVDDHAMVRQTLVKCVSSEPGFSVVAETARGEDVLELVRRFHPDVAVLDISLGREDGISIAGRVKALAPRTKILFLTVHEYELSIRRAVEMGAEGYVPKTATLEEFIEALRAVARGESYLSSSIARRVISIAGGRSANLPGSLTDRELEILEMLSSGLSSADMAAKIFLSEKTIKNHLTNIYQKLGVASAAQAVAAAFHNNLVPPN